MKYIAMLLMAAALAGCTTENQYGPCIGAFDDPEPGVKYKLDVWNTVMAVIFVETVVVPVVVIANETKCPINLPPKQVE